MGLCDSYPNSSERPSLKRYYIEIIDSMFAMMNFMLNVLSKMSSLFCHYVERFQSADQDEEEVGSRFEDYTSDRRVPLHDKCPAPATL